MWAATGLILASMAVVFTLQATTGIDYEEWFDTADNALRTGVIPLAAGSVIILGFLAWTRWDFVWSDPKRLPMSGWMLDHRSVASTARRTS